jgi:hypothetical protein
MAVFLLSKEADSVLDSPNPFSIPLKCYFDFKSIGRIGKHTEVPTTKKYLKDAISDQEVRKTNDI